MEENKKLDDFIRKSIKEIGLEEPSASFTDSVVSKILVESEIKPVFEYQPIFSKSTWLVILSIVAVIFAYVIFGHHNLESTSFSFSQMNKIAAFNVLGRVSNLEVASTFVYGILSVTFFVVIQVLIIKQRFDKFYTLN